MTLKPPPIEVPADDPFAHDLFERRAAADVLTALTKNSEDGLVVSLNSPWGTGKTTFLRMWREELKRTGFQTLYFNAWETDFLDDALVALLGEIDLGLKHARAGATPDAIAQVSEATRKVLKIGAHLARRALPTAVKVLTRNAVDLEELTEDAISDVAERLVAEQVSSYEASRTTMAAFRDAIERLAAAATEVPAGQRRLPLVFIIDELDRCRPPHAIRVLECVKHLFSVPGVVFLIAVDRSQLNGAVACQYGAKVDCAGYLRRFFDLELSLPRPSQAGFVNSQFSRFGMRQVLADRARTKVGEFDLLHLKETVGPLFEFYSCTARDQERVFGLISLAVGATPPNEQLRPALLATLTVLKVMRPDEFGMIALGRRSTEELANTLSSDPEAKRLLHSRCGGLVEAALRVAQIDSDAVRGLAASVRDRVQGAAPGSVDQQHLFKLLAAIETCESLGYVGSRHLVVQKIELVACLID